MGYIKINNTPYERLDDSELNCEVFQDLSLDQLLQRMSLAEARFISLVSKMGGNLLKTGISKAALSCSMNVGLYEDDVEDYIYDDDYLRRLSHDMHESPLSDIPSQFRLLRSARAVLYVYSDETSD